jgi:hypothetical protein
MKTNRLLTAAIILIVAAILAACGLPAATPTPDLDMQIQTAIAATATAQALFDQSVDQAVQATVTAMPPTPTPGPSVDYYALTEEELAALIDQAVADAMTATQASNTATTQAASDGTITSDEVYDTIAYVYAAEAAIEYADELIYDYYELYADIAYETIALLQAIESDLSAMNASLQEVSAILEQGAEAASAAIDQLNAAAAQIQTRANEAQTQVQDFQQKLQTELSDREKKYTGYTPQQVEDSRIGAFIQAHDFVDAYKNALSDGKFSPDELANIGQLSINAKASLYNTGDPQLIDFANRIDGLTRSAARGEWPQARSGISDFEVSLPARPQRR